MSGIIGAGKSWIKRHKKQILIGGGVILAVGVGVGLYVVIKNNNTIAVVADKAKTLKLNNIKPTSLPSPGITVSPTIDLSEEAFEKIMVSVDQSFIRTLPEGWHHSAAKAAEAADLGILLLDNQTIVDPYTYWKSIA